MNVELSILIELNDSSHNQPKVKVRDQRLREFSEDTGIHLLVVKSKPHFNKKYTEYIKKHIDRCLSAKDIVYCEC